MPSTALHVQLQKWAKEYGPIFSVMLGCKTMIVLTSPHAVRELLDKRSGIYSSRPELYIAQICTGHNNIGLMPYGARWRMFRKLTHTNLNINAAKSYVPYQNLENKQMLSDMLDRPELFVQHLRRYTSSLTTQMLFGVRTCAMDDPFITQLFEDTRKLSVIIRSSAAAFLDIFPALRVLPDFFLPQRRYAKSLYYENRSHLGDIWSKVKTATENGTAKPCISMEFLRDQQISGYSDEAAAFMVGTLLEGGTDTTSNTLVGFVQAMVLFPEVQKKAQEDIDRICGDRLPTMEDEPNLQYVRACIKEVLRWMPTAILGVPHAAIEDDEYMGYKIPKGADIVSNIWGIHMDENIYPNPRTFDPTRYEHDFQTAFEATCNPDVSKRDHFGFGAGRRICPGMHVAERSLYIGISRLLWGFNIEKALDENGNEIVPDSNKIKDGLLAMPEPFPAKITPRSERHAQIIREEWHKCQGLLDQDMQWNEVPADMVCNKNM
ncbi:hypothetical protein FQN51_007467 [Onygenales sp. PD_10]|nr:hypothetical protein FQN51_007467 [Onygenales sp. PD_10]